MLTVKINEKGRMQAYLPSGEELPAEISITLKDTVNELPVAIIEAVVKIEYCETKKADWAGLTERLTGQAVVN